MDRPLGEPPAAEGSPGILAIEGDTLLMAYTYKP
ncbi:hypothetical protein [Pseudomonas sp. FEN]|nr:hypothetical protein [Pseudomonas sp. FEN]